MIKRMGKIASALCVGLILGSSVNCYSYTVLGMDPPTTLEWEVGYRQDDIKWKVFSPEPDLAEYPPDPLLPLTKSTLSFNDLAVIQTAVTGKAMINCWCYIRGYAAYGRVFEKKIHERTTFTLFNPYDFAVNTENSMKNHGYMGDYSLGIGNHFQLMEGRLTAAPLVGYGYHVQEISTRNDENPLNGLAIATTGLTAAQLGFPQSDSGSNRYRTYWMGPWVGVDFWYNTVCNWIFFSETEYYFASRCTTKRRSHTGIEFFDHYHKTDSARGVNTRIGGQYYFNPCWYFGFNLKYEYWKSHKEHRHINWRSMGLGLETGYAF